ncbi:hypothetical protein [Micromonospora sp. DT227]|uniref:hypothetical protein n=1 Tax=Micromonospora sp. DT227 TaxID=3393433 RepID=UPI003CF6E73C
MNKHKGLQQFFRRLLVDEQAIDRSPMERVRQPKTPRKLIPVMRDEDTGKLLDACKGKSFANLRDEALIRLYCNAGGSRRGHIPEVSPGGAVALGHPVGLGRGSSHGVHTPGHPARPATGSHAALSSTTDLLEDDYLAVDLHVRHGSVSTGGCR